MNVNFVNSQLNRRTRGRPSSWQNRSNYNRNLTDQSLVNLLQGMLFQW